jgi:serine/threonine protein kinase
MSVQTFVGESGREWSYDDSAQIGDPSNMGDVFEGSDSEGKPVAIKRVRLLTGAEAEGRQRNRELEVADTLIAAQAGGSIVDHLLFPVDRYMDGDDLLIVMPRAERSLNAAIKNGSLNPEEIDQAIRQVVQGLIELAELGILHRDLKPANVLFHDGRWKLADFGISRIVTEPTATFTFFAWGSRPFKAPELWESKPATVKADLYALGVLAYELFTGVRPFPGPEEEDYRRQHLTQDPALPETLAPGVRRFILRLLQKDPNDRYQDARAAAEALGRLSPELGADQQALLEAALALDESETKADAERRMRGVAADEAAALRRQAAADLKELMEDAFARCQVPLPEVKLENDGLQWHLQFKKAFVTVTPFSTEVVSSSKDDQIITAWTVSSSTEPARRTPIANIVCESRPAGLTFFLLTFRASALVASNYTMGPTDRPHGFDEVTFMAERVYMVTPTTHVWQMNIEQLTADSLVRLLVDAVQFLARSKPTSEGPLPKIPWPE